jgi:hypothetical protein
MMPTTTVAAFMFRHSVEDKSSYSQTWGISSNAEFQDVYWRSLAVSLATCRRLNPHVKLAVYTNAPGLPVVDRVALDDLFTDLAVDVRVLPWCRRPPRMLPTWGCTLFQLDVLEDLARRKTDVVFLDVDTVWLRPAGQLLHAIPAHPLITYDLRTGIDDPYNGLTPRQIAAILRRYVPEFDQEAVRYTGGEFLAASADAMRVMAGCIAALWPAVEADLSAGRLTFTREEHYLSAVYAVTLGGNDLGNAFIRRIWTNYGLYGARPEDLGLTIWHLPSEKRFGFRWAFRDLVHGRIPDGNSASYLPYLVQVMGVPRRPVQKVVRDWVSVPGVPKNLLKSRVRHALSSTERQRLPVT